ncbi:hypothetical protein BJX70DRAFT_399723 [Aspergillus crustosus]
MPLLAGFVIAGDRFRVRNQSFHLYNITRGLYTYELAGWFTRWVQCQKFEAIRSIVYCEVISRPPRRTRETALAASLATGLLGFLFALTLLSGDLYGLANTLALLVMVVGRVYMLHLNRRAIDCSILRLASSSAADNAKTILVTPDSKVAYKCAQWVCWAAFAVHVVTPGMACLGMQIYTIALVTGASILLCHGCDCDDSVSLQRCDPDGNRPRKWYTCMIGTRLKATLVEWRVNFEFKKSLPEAWVLCERSDSTAWEKRYARRMDLYAWLNLSQEEEDSLIKWDLIPHRRKHNDSWSTEFKAKQALINDLQLSVMQIKKDAQSSQSDSYQGQGKRPSDSETAID